MPWEGQTDVSRFQVYSFMENKKDQDDIKRRAMGVEI